MNLTTIPTATIKKPETIHLAAFLATDIGKEFVERIGNIVSDLGEKPASETALRYLCAYEAHVFLSEVEDEDNCGFRNYEVDKRILSATIDELMAAFETWLDSEYCSSIIALDPDDARLEQVSILQPWSMDEEYGLPWSDVNPSNPT